MHWLTGICASLTAQALIVFVRGLTAVRAHWQTGPVPGPRVYFANHGSHADSVLIWAVLPPRLRQKTRPVAAADYWLKGSLRRYLAASVFTSVLIDRIRSEDSPDPIEAMSAALDAGDSLIFFPEGTRNTSETRLLPFKSGLFRLAEARPRIEFVPVWIENLNRVLPKGELLPVPLLCTVTFGRPITIRDREPHTTFLERARQALLNLAPDQAPHETRVET